MIELTEQQQREIAAAGWPPRVYNPVTRETFVLIHPELFERVRAILEAEDEIPAVEDMGALTGEVLDEDTSSRESA